MKKYVTASLITLSFLVAFFLYVPIQDLKAKFYSVGLFNLALAFLSYTVSQLARSLRWKVLIHTLTLREAFLINSVNILFNNVLPARTGELSWFYYANRLGVDLKASLWYFFVGKLYDLIVIVAISLLSVYLTYKNPYVLLSLVTVVLAALLFGKIHSLLPSWKKLKELKSFIKEKMSVWLSIKLLMFSSVSILFKFFGVYLLVGGDPMKLFLGFSAGELSSIMPIHNFMGYGTYEISFSLPLRILDSSMKSALLDAFLVHNFLLLSSFMLGIPSLLLIHLKKRW